MPEVTKLMQGSLLLVAVIGVTLVPFWLQDRQGKILQVFAVGVLAFVPGWLFLRFVIVRARSVWDEYVLNLHRLGIDRPQYLPEPPTCSIYHTQWRDAGGEKQCAHASIYRQKFEAYYGKGTARDAEDWSRRLRAETFLPVVVATVVFAVGWQIVLTRRSIFTWPVGINPELPADALCFAFMGAYLFQLQILVRRYFQADLKAGAYVSALVRVVSALILAGVVLMLLQASDDRTRLAVAFVIGFFPMVGLQALQKAAAVALRTVVPTLRNSYPLSDIDGLSVWYESRLLELGIEDMQNLATANFVDVILHSRVPVGRLVDWVDQAILYLHLEPLPHPRRDKAQSSRTRLRRLGIRNATSLQEALRPEASEPGNAELIEALRWVLNDKPAEGWPSISQTVLRTLGSETNLDHVLHWKKEWRKDAVAGTPGPLAGVAA